MVELFWENVGKLKRLRKRKVEQLSKGINDYMAVFERIKPEIIKIIEEADEMGAIIAAARINVPSQIFDKFHKGERGTLALLQPLRDFMRE